MNYNQYKDSFNAIPECKYRLPCGWCDRINEVCTLYQAYKATINNVDGVNEKEIGCDHHWVYNGSYYFCSKCGVIREVTYYSGINGKPIL